MRRGRRRGFTLLEVLVAVAVAGLVVAAGFKLITLSLNTLSQVVAEQSLVNEAQRVYLDFLAKKDMPDTGERKDADETYVVKWKVDTDSVPVADDLELTFRRLAVEYRGREMILYLPE
ncbi:MAG: prepilin-type N-terminal cleavage/methylation domain-containing protein [Synergistaceae bacterium]|jgi:prepilin-type N-terminal cleavage/methylation domain-containing protein|nr:prepilin-type N-terminal cleavage/methylation domain-containing protein [Synergistaceae bacterium]